MKTDFFPQGVATGKAFLERTTELQQLRDNVAHGHHTLLVAPRRYGKTSLAKNALQALDTHFVVADVSFFLCRTGLSVERKIRHCITETLRASEGKLGQDLFNTIRQFFKRSKKKWTFGFKGMVGIELTPETEEEVEENIFTALSLLDSTLSEASKKAVLFFDEVQEIDLLPEGKQIQGAIREFAQESKNIVFIFSGSNRRLLRHMFGDASMPLYELCEHIILKKISAESYKNYLNFVAQESFGETLQDDVIEKILSLSERHPKRVYNLCYQLWQSKPIGHFSTDDVSAAWEQLIESRQKDVRSKLAPLNNSQLAVLTLLAVGFEGPISGKEAQRKMNLSSPSIVRAIEFLEDEDFITLAEKGRYTFIDPLIKWVLCKYEAPVVE